MQYEPDIVFLTETSLKCNEDNSVFLCRKNFEIFRQDRIVEEREITRLSNVGGGVAILCKRELRPCALEPIEGVEGLWIELTKPRKILLGCFYRPHVSCVTQMQNILSCFQTKMPKYNEIVICGDFNLPGINWNEMKSSKEHNIYF